jgi:hypothetical protein
LFITAFTSMPTGHVNPDNNLESPCRTEYVHRPQWLQEHWDHTRRGRWYASTFHRDPLQRSVLELVITELWATHVLYCLLQYAIFVLSFHFSHTHRAVLLTIILTRITRTMFYTPFQPPTPTQVGVQTAAFSATTAKTSLVYIYRRMNEVKPIAHTHTCSKYVQRSAVPCSLHTECVCAVTVAQQAGT